MRGKYLMDSLRVALLAFTMLLSGYSWSSGLDDAHSKRPATYCDEMMAKKGSPIPQADADTLRGSDRIFYAAIEIGGVDIKGSLYEIHEWSPAKSEIIIPCEISLARIKLPLRHEEDDYDAIEDTAEAVSDAVAQLNKYRPRILKILVGPSVTQQAYWKDLKKVIEWQTSLAPIEIDQGQELIYTVMSDFHLPRLDACVADSVWQGEPSSWSRYCTTLACEERGDESDFGFCTRRKEDVSYLDRTGFINGGLKREEHNYIYANLGSSGTLLGFVSETMRTADAITLPGTNRIFSQYRDARLVSAQTVGAIPVNTEHGPREIMAQERISEWVNDYKGVLSSKSGVRVVGGGAWAYFISSDLSRAATAYSGLLKEPATQICKSLAEISGGKNQSALYTESDSLVLALHGRRGISLSQVQSLIRAKQASGSGGSGIYSELGMDPREYSGVIDQLDLIFNRVGMANDPGRYRVAMKSTEVMLSVIGNDLKAHRADANFDRDCTFSFPTTASGSWVRGYVSMLDPRNEPAIRR